MGQLILTKLNLRIQVLSEEALRAKYDAHGAKGLDAAELVDSAAFFAAMFGSEPFEYLVQWCSSAVVK